MYIRNIITGFLLQFLVIPMAFASHIFYDVWDSSEYHEPTQYLHAKGVIKGYPDGSFKPNAEINRVEVLKILLEGAKISVPKVTVLETVGFSDVIAGQWYVKYIKKAKILGIIQGYPDNTFRPSMTVRLSEALKMTMETYSDFIDSINFPDNLPSAADVKLSDWFSSYVRKALYLGLIDKDGKSKVYPGAFINRGKFAQIIYRLLKAKEARESQISQCPCTVNIQNLTFNPSKLLIRKGSKVIFQNQDGVDHQVASDFSALNGPVMHPQSEPFEVIFSERGVYTYYCGLHPPEIYSGIAGTIEVIP